MFDDLILKAQRMILCFYPPSIKNIPHSKSKRNHWCIINNNILNKYWKLPVFGEQMVGCFCCHKYTMRKWNALDKERVEGLQIKLEQTEYCIMMLHPTSAAENTEVLFPLCPSIMAHRTARLQDRGFTNSTITIHSSKWITAIVLF